MSSSGGNPYNPNRSYLALGLVGFGFLTLLAANRKIREAEQLEKDLQAKGVALAALSKAQFEAKRKKNLQTFFEFTKEQQERERARLIAQQSAVLLELKRNVEAELKRKAEELKENPNDKKLKQELQDLQRELQDLQKREKNVPKSIQVRTRRTEEEQQDFRSDRNTEKIANQNRMAVLKHRLLKNPKSQEDSKELDRILQGVTKKDGEILDRLLKKPYVQNDLDELIALNKAVQESTELLYFIDEYLAGKKAQPIRKEKARQPVREALPEAPAPDPGPTPFLLETTGFRAEQELIQQQLLKAREEAAAAKLRNETIRIPNYSALGFLNLAAKPPSSSTAPVIEEADEDESEDESESEDEPNV